jgi:Leucine zipper with capping helix domain
VDKEKIGGSNYFWSFPAKQDRKLQLQHQETLSAIERLREQLQQAESELADAKRGREEDTDPSGDGDADMMNRNSNEEDGSGTANASAGTTTTKSISHMSRAAKLQRLQEIEQARTAYQQELAILKENDPQALADLEKELQLCKDAANRWTDNIFNCKSYLIKKRGLDKKEAMRILNITSAFDCK